MVGGSSGPPARALCEGPGLFVKGRLFLWAKDIHPSLVRGPGQFVGQVTVEGTELMRGRTWVGSKKAACWPGVVAVETPFLSVCCAEHCFYVVGKEAGQWLSQK